MYDNAETGRQRRPRRRRTASRTIRECGNNRARQRNPSTSSTSPRSQLWMATGVVGLLGVWFLTPASDYMVHVMLLSVPLQADIDLGHESYKTFRRKYKQVRDVYGIRRIGAELVGSSYRLPSNDRSILYDVTEYQWDFGVIEANLVNAFALPGGIVRVTTALLDQLDLTEGELAALLGHELGHVLHRHSQARVIKQKLFTTLLRALFYSDEDDHQETFGEAVGELLLTSAQYLGDLRFSRQNEYEADSMSWELLYASRRYNPRALESLLSKLWSLEGDSSTGETSWESTHPGTQDRIAALRLKWTQLPMYEQNRLENYPLL